MPTASRCSSPNTASPAARREAASTTRIPSSKRQGCSQTVSAPTLVVSAPELIFQRGQAGRDVAIQLAPFDVRRQPARQRDAAIGGDDDARVPLAGQLAQGAVHDAQPADAHGGTERLGLGQAQDHRYHGAGWNSDPGRRDDRDGARDRAKLCRTVNHHD